MFAAGFGPPEIGLILVIVLVLFGGSQLPKLAKNLGKAQKEFKDGLADGQKADGKTADGKTADGKTADATKSSSSADE